MLSYVARLAPYIVVNVAASQALSLARPLQLQRPLVARVNKPYSWTFAPPFDAFDTQTQVAYTLSRAPPWLSLDPHTLTFSGTPSENDFGSSLIAIQAIVGQEKATDKAVICISDRFPPQVNYTVSAQLNRFNPSLSSIFIITRDSALYASNGVPSLRIPPSWSFSIGFESTTFVSGNDRPMFYYSSALPGWVTFNPSDLTYDGVTPQLSSEANSTELWITLHGSDEEGCSAVQQSFRLVVTAHELSLNNSFPPLKLAAGQVVNKTLALGDLAGLTFDEAPLDSLADMSFEMSKSPTSLLTLSNWTLAGIAPYDAGQAVLPISLTHHKIGQTLRTNLTLDVSPSLFVHPLLPPFLIEPDAEFELNLKQYFVNGTVYAKLDVSTSKLPVSWLKFDPVVLRMSGRVPKDEPKQRFNITLSARETPSNTTYQAQLAIEVASPSDVATDEGAIPTRHRARTILISVLSLVGGIIFLVSLVTCCKVCFRKKEEGGSFVVDARGNRYWREKGALDNGQAYHSPRDLEKREISFEDAHTGGPIPNAPLSLIPGGRLRQAEFFNLVKNSFGKKTRNARPPISQPVLVSVVGPGYGPSQLAAPTDSHQPVTRIDSFENSSISTNSTDLAIITETPKRRRDFAPPTSPRIPFVPHLSVPDWSGELSNSGNSSEMAGPSSASNTAPEKARLVEFSSSKKGQDGMASAPRKVSQRGVVVSASDESALKLRKGGDIGRRDPHSNVQRGYQPSIYAASSASDGAIRPPMFGNTKSTTQNAPAFGEEIIAASTPSKKRGVYVVHPYESTTWVAPFRVPPSHPDLHAVLVDGRELPWWLHFTSEGMDGVFSTTWKADEAKVNKAARIIREQEMDIVVSAGGAELGKVKVVLQSRN